MATYNTAFGTLPGYNEMLGTTNTTGGGEQQVYSPTRQFQTQRTTYGRAGQEGPVQTFAQLQRQGMARPAPAAPQAQPVQQFGGSAQAQQTRQRLQQQLEEFGQAPSRFDTAAFQQIRGAQAANLQAEYQAQQQQLNEELARRGLYASSIGGGRMGDLAGQQARALADIDAQLLQRAAETQAADRAQLLQAGGQLAELAGAQDLAQFEANRVAQAAEFENQLRAAQFAQGQYEQGTGQALQAAQAQQAAGQFGAELGLRLAELTGQAGGLPTLAAQQQAEQRRQFDIQQALQQQLGLGGLALQERAQAAQEQQFGLTQAQQQAQFAAQLGISQQELGLRSQQLQQEAAQFGLSLNEQQAARMQQYGLSVQELGLRTEQVRTEAALQGRSLDQQQAQNVAQNQLEQQRIQNQASQFGLQLTEQQAARMQQFGISTQELALETQRVTNQATQFGQQLSATVAQNQAQNNLEQARINEAIQQRLTGAQESAAERALRERMQGTEQTFQRSETALERTLRQTLGMRELDIRQQEATSQAQLAQNQLILQLAQALGSLTPTQIQNIVRTGTETPIPEQQPTESGSYVGERRILNGVTWEWNGASWFRVGTQG